MSVINAILAGFQRETMQNVGTEEGFDFSRLGHLLGERPEEWAMLYISEELLKRDHLLTKFDVQISQGAKFLVRARKIVPDC